MDRLAGRFRCAASLFDHQAFTASDFKRWNASWILTDCTPSHHRKRRSAHAHGRHFRSAIRTSPCTLNGKNRRGKVVAAGQIEVPTDPLNKLKIQDI